MEANLLDENLKYILGEIEEAENKRYEGMALVEVLMLYQQVTELLWTKVNILLNKDN